MDPAGIRRSVADWERMWERLPTWRGVPCQQFPSDLWRYAEVIHELAPPWVLETGTADGGTALFLADAAGCPVVSVDTGQRAARVDHDRLTLVESDATDPVTVTTVAAMANLGGRGLVLLDDDHSSAHVLAELDAYAPLADYLVVEDTLMEHLPQYDDGPHLALAKWLPGHPEFTADPDPVPTNHPGGWLRRVAGLAGGASGRMTLTSVSPYRKSQACHIAHG